MSVPEHWYCSGSRPEHRKCRNLPCHGHNVTRDQLLVAQALAWDHGDSWWVLTYTNRREWYRRAYAALSDVRASSEVLA